MKILNKKIIVVSILGFLSSTIWAQHNVPHLQYSVKNSKNGTIIHIIKGDLLKLPFKVEAIVNAANIRLQHGGGIAAAISKAAGPELQKASNALIDCQGPVPVGSARVTNSYQLKNKGIKHIIHAVGPDCRDPQQNKNRKTLLKKAYYNSLNSAANKRISSIAFPSISTAIFKYRPLDGAAQLALGTTIAFAKHKKTTLKNIYFVLFDQKQYELYSSLCNKNTHLVKVQ